MRRMLVDTALGLCFLGLLSLCVAPLVLLFLGFWMWALLVAPFSVLLYSLMLAAA